AWSQRTDAIGLAQEGSAIEGGDPDGLDGSETGVDEQFKPALIAEAGNISAEHAIRTGEKKAARGHKVPFELHFLAEHLCVSLSIAKHTRFGSLVGAQSLRRQSAANALGKLASLRQELLKNGEGGSEGHAMFDQDANQAADVFAIDVDVGRRGSAWIGAEVGLFIGGKLGIDKEA